MRRLDDDNTLRRATSAVRVYQTSLPVTATGRKDLGP